MMYIRNITLILMCIFLPRVTLAQVYTCYENTVMNIEVHVADDISGIGNESLIQFSNDGTAWSDPEPYVDLKEWNVDDINYGGDASQKVKKVCARVSDNIGNWSDVICDNITIEKQTITNYGISNNGQEDGP